MKTRKYIGFLGPYLLLSLLFTQEGRAEYCCCIDRGHDNYDCVAGDGCGCCTYPKQGSDWYGPTAENEEGKDLCTSKKVKTSEGPAFIDKDNCHNEKKCKS